MKRAATMKKAAFGKIGWRLIEEFTRCGRKFRHVRTAVAFQEKSSRAAGRMEAAVGLSLNDQRASAGGDCGAKACPGDSATDDQDIEIKHLRRRGYELESPAV